MALLPSTFFRLDMKMKKYFKTASIVIGIAAVIVGYLYFKASGDTKWYKDVMDGLPTHDEWVIADDEHEGALDSPWRFFTSTPQYVYLVHTTNRLMVAPDVYYFVQRTLRRDGEPLTQCCIYAERSGKMIAGENEEVVVGLYTSEDVPWKNPDSHMKKAAETVMGMKFYHTIDLFGEEVDITPAILSGDYQVGNIIVDKPNRITVLDLLNINPYEPAQEDFLKFSDQIKEHALLSHPLCSLNVSKFSLRDWSYSNTSLNMRSPIDWFEAKIQGRCGSNDTTIVVRFAFPENYQNGFGENQGMVTIER